MKKTLIIVAAACCFALSAAAQPKALGVRIGNFGWDLSYENYVFKNSDFVEFELGFKTNDFHLDGLYNFDIVKPDWTPKGTWCFYAGPGASVAAFGHKNDDKTTDTNVYVGIVGNAGLEYTFPFNLQLALDCRPRLMFGDGGVYSRGIFTFGFAIRYAF